MNKEYKIVDNYLFFLTGWLSQWYKSEFNEFGQRFVNCEQYMMYSKARLFNDAEVAAEILIAKNPAEHKQLGRMVRNFNQELWNKYKFDIVYRGNYLKFSQNEELGNLLKATGNYELVEANKEDMIWGIGMYDDDPNLMKKELWGENLLGKALMNVRQDINCQCNLERKEKNDR